MAIPGYEAFLLPLLRLAADGQEHRSREAYERMAEVFSLTEADRQEMLPSGSQPLLNNRVAWALTYLRQAGLVASPKRGVFRITTEGEALLRQGPAEVNARTLENYPAFLDFKHRTRKANSSDDAPNETVDGSASSPLPTPPAADGGTPDEEMAQAWRRHRLALESDVLEQVKAASPAFFERLVVDVLVKMGYGGNRVDAGQSVGRSGDGGIDGIINEDPLGLDVVYVQAKRWEGTVGRPEVQRFAGALQGRRARKGVFITTAEFTREAKDYAGLIETRIVLIDGTRLARLMVDHGVGVSLAGTYLVQRVDTDYFAEG